MIKAVFMGTPKFAADILQYLIDDNNVDIVGYQTAPDKIRGRGKKLVPSPVKHVANANNIPEEIPEDIDFILVAAYGKIVNEEILNHPKYCCLNVHGSLLPKWRGAAPVERAILAGDEYTGESIMRMEKGMDTGDYCAQNKIEIAGKNYETIMNEMAELGARDLVCAMQQIISNEVNWTKQDETQVTFANKIEKHELNLDDSAISSKRKIQASNNAHPAKCVIGNRVVAVLEAKLVDKNLEESKVLFQDKKLYLGFSDGCLEILTLKPDGKNIMQATAFAAGIQNIRSGEIEWKKM